MSAPFYLNIAAGNAPLRLKVLQQAAYDNAKPGQTWRDARECGLHNWESAYCELSQGFNGEGRNRRPVWYAHTGEQFRNERYCHDIVRSCYAGWHTDADQQEEARGIVASLPHGRFIAGYEWSSNDERVYFADVFDNDTDAALMADEHARVFAEAEMDHSERFDAAQQLETKIEDAFTRLRECLTLRNNPCFEYAREEIAELIASIRDNRDELKTNFAGVL